MNRRFGIGSVRVGNKRPYSDFKPEIDEVVINIDRPNPLGNTFSITPERRREQVIELFRNDLELEIKRREGPRYRAVLEIAEHLLSGRDVYLACWCKPLPCHGDVIVEVVERLLKP
jgi:hypothetical protein